MSLAKKAVAGFLYTTAANVGSRVITIISTFILTRYLTPEVQGEVNVAVVLIMSAGWATSFGVGQYLAAHPKSGRVVAFHGSVILLTAGVIACVLCVLGRFTVASWLHTPGMVAYVPGLALSHFIDRLGWLPRNILVRDMRFRVIGARVALGEIVYAASTVAFAHAGFGGQSIVAGNLARATIGLLYLAAVTERREYLEPCRLSMEIFRKLLSYGAPIGASFLFHVGATTWDNLFISYRFGEAATGLYNQAYRLADLPATNVGEQINDVLVPSFARLEDPESRKRGLLRAAGLMALVVFPMAAGLGAVAHTLVETLYPKSYSGVAPFLAVLAALSMYRSIGVLATGYLQVVGRTKIFVLLDIILVAVLLGSMALLAPLGPVYSAFGVGVAFTVNTLQIVHALKPEGITLGAVAKSVARPFVACLPMAAAVLGLRALMGGHGPAAVRLLAEVVVGGGVYIGAALVIARAISRDFIDLGMGIVRRRRQRSGGSDAPESSPASE